MANTFLLPFLTIASLHFLAMITPGPDFILATKNALLYPRRQAVYTSLGIALGLSIHISYCILGVAILIVESHWLFNLIKYLGAIYLIYIGVTSWLSNTTAPAKTKTLAPEVQPFDSRRELRKQISVAPNIIPEGVQVSGKAPAQTSSEASGQHSQNLTLSSGTNLDARRDPKGVKSGRDFIKGEGSIKIITPWQALCQGFLCNLLNPKATLFLLGLFSLVVKPATPIWQQLIYGIWMVSTTFIWFATIACLITHPQARSKIAQIQHTALRVVSVFFVIMGVSLIFFTT